MKNLLLTLSALGILCSILAITGCYQAENSASMALDNAASAVRHEGNKVWIDPDATPMPTNDRD